MTPQSPPASIAKIAVHPEDRFAIVVSRYNEEITRRLLDGAVATFHKHQIADERVRVDWVPGAFELPLAAKQLAQRGHYAGIVCLGAVIQGETTHHDYINHQVAAGIMQVGLDTGIPVAFGVLTCQTWELALDRAGGKSGNKGEEAALAALEMAQLARSLAE